VKAESDRFDNQGTEVSSHTLLDVRSNYQINDQLSLDAKISNVFDKDYAVNLIGTDNQYNTGGRQAEITLRYNF